LIYNLIMNRLRPKETRKTLVLSNGEAVKVIVRCRPIVENERKRNE
jgi:bifunctional DNA-binding transcriptional regulator/antitoxin component of YhaV-PrlF toxin-antitoxin module